MKILLKAKACSSFIARDTQSSVSLDATPGAPIVPARSLGGLRPIGAGRISALVAPVLVIFLVQAFGRLQAAPVGQGKAARTVQTWVRRVTADRRPEAVVERMESFQQRGTTAAYIVHLAGGGYCLAGADSLVLPVYWYCPRGVFDARNPETRFILEEIAQRSDYLRRETARGGPAMQAHKDTLDKRAVFWEALEREELPDEAQAEADAAARLELPLTCQWGQGSPYNDACPEIPPGSGNRCPVGCVATAMSQVMYYWRWPSSYQWNILRDRHTDPVDAGDIEVARLCHDAGVAVNMTYTPTNSGADPSDIPGALASDFNYSSDAEYGDRDVNRMVTEIQWLRPLLFGGRNTNDEGHRWIVFGYNKSTTPWQFLMNLGWDGGSDGWYSVDQAPDGLIESQTHVTRVAPRGAVRFVGASSLGDGSPDDPYRNIEEALAEAPSSITLIFKANSDNTFAASSLTIARSMTLKGANATIRKQ